MDAGRIDVIALEAAIAQAPSLLIGDIHRRHLVGAKRVLVQAGQVAFEDQRHPIHRHLRACVASDERKTDGAEAAERTATSAGPTENDVIPKFSLFAVTWSVCFSRLAAGAGPRGVREVPHDEGDVGNPESEKSRRN